MSKLADLAVIGGQFDNKSIANLYRKIVCKVSNKFANKGEKQFMNSEKQLHRSRKKTLLIFAVTVPETMSFFNHQIQYLIESGFEVAVICSPGWHNKTAAQYYPIKMEREISLFQDVKSLISIIRLLIFLRPDIINAGTPKASFLVGIAGFLIRVPVRIYMCHGLRLETLKGWKRKIVFLTECVTAACATRICCVSNSVKNRLQELRIANPCKLDVIGSGSVNGIDINKFHPLQRRGVRQALLKKHAIPKNGMVVGFVGRLTKDKGLPEAIIAFNHLKQSFDNIFLVLVGDFEAGDPLPHQTLTLIHRDPKVILAGFTTRVDQYYHMFNLLWLPSHREGMPTVLLEAAASGLPTVACLSTGCIDAVEDGKTGYLVPVGDSKSLAAYTKKLLLEKSLGATMGQEGRRRVEKYFDQKKVWENMKRYYQNLLNPKLQSNNLQQACGEKIIKRVMDICGAVCLLTVLLPLMVFIAVLVHVKLGSPIIFKQLRPGIQGQPFHIYKFRTMTEETDESGNLLQDNLRITSFGHFLRRVSLDELPQLFNVLKGDLSLVGPRPLLMEYLPLYSLDQARRHDVQPGITGWAQVNGRNLITWEEKFVLDIWYVENQCFWLDMKILWMTLVKVWIREGISQRGNVTMQKFRGNDQCRDY